MHSHTVLPRSLLLLAGLTLSVLFSAHRPGSAAGRRRANSRTSPAGRGVLRGDLFKGSVSASTKDKDHQEAADIAAKEAVYPLYWETVARRRREEGWTSRWPSSRAGFRR